MRILLLSPTDIKGGASKVAFTLAEGLIRSGIDVELHVTRRFSEECFVHQFPDGAKGENAFVQRICHRLGINGLNLQSPFPRNLRKAYFERFDVIHLHDLPTGFNLSQLSWLARQAPVVWSVHSMWPFTGNCQYAYSCDRWRSTCGECPQFGQWPLHWLHRDASRSLQRLKRHFYHRAHIHFVGVGNWMSECLRTSTVCNGQDISIIPNAIDPADFFVMDRQAAKERLGIPANALAVMFAVSGDPKDNRKGLDLITAALSRGCLSNVYLMPTGIGDISREMAAQLAAFPGLSPRHLASADELRLYYNAADIFWHPSRADNAPLSLLEAEACGTPVIASDVGGVSDIVKDGVNGLLIEPDSSEQLVVATRKLIADPRLLRALTEGARERAAVNSMNRFIVSHLELYGNLCNRRKGVLIR